MPSHTSGGATPKGRAILPAMLPGGEPSRDGRWLVFACSALRIASRSARRCSAPCERDNTVQPLPRYEPSSYAALA